MQYVQPRHISDCTIMFFVAICLIKLNRNLVKSLQRALLRAKSCRHYEMVNPEMWGWHILAEKVAFMAAKVK